MIKYTKSQLEERYQKLPEVLKDAMFSADVAEKMFALGRKFGLTIEKTGFMAEEVGYVILGLTKPEELREILEKRLDLDKDEVKNLGSEINNQIFLPLREALKSAYQMEVVEEKIAEPPVSETPPPPKPAAAVPPEKPVIEKKPAAIQVPPQPKIEPKSEIKPPKEPLAATPPFTKPLTEEKPAPLPKVESVKKPFFAPPPPVKKSPEFSPVPEPPKKPVFIPPPPPPKIPPIDLRKEVPKPEVMRSGGVFSEPEIKPKPLREITPRPLPENKEKLSAAVENVLGAEEAIKKSPEPVKPETPVTPPVEKKTPDKGYDPYREPIE